MGKPIMNTRAGRPNVAKKPSARQLKRDRYWPDSERRLWHRKTSDGYTTLPKTMPLILEIMERVEKGGPALSRTYLALWCNTWDDSYVEVKSEDQLAFEAGFAQPNLARRRLEWRKRMQQLEALAFIETRKADLAYQHVILWNPHEAVTVLLDKYPERIGDALKNALLDKATDIGAKDLLSEYEGGAGDGTGDDGKDKSD
jgi:hypothetical protein